MILYRDVPDITIRELCALAEQIRKAPAGSKRAAALSARMGAAAMCLRDARVFEQLLCWVASAHPEPPPRTTADVIEFPSRPHLVG